MWSVFDVPPPRPPGVNARAGPDPVPRALSHFKPQATHVVGVRSAPRQDPRAQLGVGGVGGLPWLGVPEVKRALF